MNGNFLKLNVNPKHRKTTDCVIRAIATATGKDWYEVFDALCAISRKKAVMLDDKPAYETYLKENGFRKQSCQPMAGNCRDTVKELAGTLNKPAVVQVAHHLVAIDGRGNYIDTWDSGSNCAYTLWIKQ